jgi:hypothetical protein
MRLFCLGIFLFLLSASGNQPARAQEVMDGGIKDREAALTFCKELQRAVKDGEKRKIASWINGFPIEVQHGDQTVLVADELDFVQKFDLIFDTHMKISLSRPNACDLHISRDGSAKIAEDKIGIDQVEAEPNTFISTISPPADFDSTFEDNDKYESGAAAFFKELQKAISAGDRHNVANMCEYPLSVNVGGKHRLVRSRVELIAQYPSIFNTEVNHAVLSLSAPIHAGWRGFMTGQGELWFDAVVGTHVFRVRTVNGVSLRREKRSEKKRNSSLQRCLDESEGSLKFAS